jgi:isopentenyldiphosphate isomerase
MGKELLDIYDQKMNHIGVVERKEVHQKGYWHKAFHCWFYQIEEGALYVLFQKRKEDKDTHPNLLDITAAGHLTAGERVEDGIREVEEELGVKVQLNELESMDVINASYQGETFIDNEFCYTFFYHFTDPLSTIVPDYSEVSGIYKIPFESLKDLFDGALKSLNITGYEYMNQQLVSNNVEVKYKDFVPHPPEYYNIILDRLSLISARIKER